MTKNQIGEYARWLSDSVGLEWLADHNATGVSLELALNEALTEYYKLTKCSRVYYTHAATSGTATYALSAINAAASRIFELTYVAFNNVPLERTTINCLDNELDNWRHLTATATPQYWVPYKGGIRLFPTPNSTDTIYIEGFETPDLTLFTDTSEPAIVPVSDQKLLAIYVAILCTTREPSNPNIMRTNVLYPQWQNGIYNAATAELPKWEY